jgi:hypothetical protein
MIWWRRTTTALLIWIIASIGALIVLRSALVSIVVLGSGFSVPQRLSILVTAVVTAWKNLDDPVSIALAIWPIVVALLLSVRQGMKHPYQVRRLWLVYSGLFLFLDGATSNVWVARSFAIAAILFLVRAYDKPVPLTPID